MPLSGEAIRTMNYVDDISVTLRRILTVLPSLTDEERRRVSEHIKSAEPSYESVITAVAEQKVMPEAIQPSGGIGRVAVIGAGQAGRRFALRCALAGFRVVLEDVMPANSRAAQSEFADLTGQMRPGSLDFALTVEDAVRDADIAVDFVPDELESKLEIFCLMDRMAPPKTVLCTPSYALSITDLASCTYRGDRCVAVQGDLTTGNDILVLHPPSVSKIVVADVQSFFAKLGVQSLAQDDRNAPMLMKNAKT